MAKILVAGDFAPLNRITKKINNNDYSFFDSIREITSKYDYSIVNLEAPIASDPNKKISKWGPNLNAPANTVDAIKYAGFNMATLANNHIKDYGSYGIKKTIRSLNLANIDYVGVGDSLAEAGKIKYISLDSEIIAFINCCETEYSVATEHSEGSNPINPINLFYSITEARSKAQKVIIIVHGGTEGFQYPSERMVDSYRFFIDCGADAVINHHQHCFSGYEIYRDKPIFYGLGNFCFDLQNKKLTKWNKGYMAVIDTQNLNAINIIPYEQCFDEPTVRLLPQDAYTKEILEINETIGNRQLLNEKYSEICKKYYMNISLTFQPYSNRILSALYRRKLIPSLISKKTLLRIANNIMCESHFEKIKFYLSEKLK